VWTSQGGILFSSPSFSLNGYIFREDWKKTRPKNCRSRCAQITARTVSITVMGLVPSHDLTKGFPICFLSGSLHLQWIGVRPHWVLGAVATLGKQRQGLFRLTGGAEHNVVNLASPSARVFMNSTNWESKIFRKIRVWVLNMSLAPQNTYLHSVCTTQCIRNNSEMTNSTQKDVSKLYRITCHLIQGTKHLWILVPVEEILKPTSLGYWGTAVVVTMELGQTQSHCEVCMNP
jgi:hypothetical protein